MRALALLLSVLAVLGGVAYLLLRGDDGPQWSTDSNAAVAEFEAGLAALDKLYTAESMEHLERAHEADPDFLMPKVWLILGRHYNPETRTETEQLVADLRQADLQAVSSREAMLVRWLLANIDRDYQRARGIVEQYLAEHPDDPFAVGRRCDWLWQDQRWDEARGCYLRLAELAPNQIQAQNRIGYLEMSQGHFDEAEAQFEIYRYLAPDQANPHDSMGELMMVMGRYDEAEEEFRAALALKDDFCASWRNLVGLERLRGDFDRAAAVLAEAQASNGCPEGSLDPLTCSIELWRQAEAGRWADAAAASQACGEGTVEKPLAYLASLAAGDSAPLDAAIDEIRAELGDDAGSRPRPYLQHLLALQALGRNEPEAAIEAARTADEAMAYWSGDWAFKLHNRHLLLNAYEAAGRGDDAAELRQEVEDVNPRFLDAFPFPELR